MKKWWKVLKWSGKPGPSIPRKFIRTIRDENEIKTLTYLRSFGVGWWTVNAYENPGGAGNIRGHSIKLAWHVTQKRLRSGEIGLIAELWQGLIPGQVYVKDYLIKVLG